MVDFFCIDSYFDDASKLVNMLARVEYRNSCGEFVAERVQYFFAHEREGIYFIFEEGLIFENDFDDFIFCYGEELGVPIRKERVKFEIKTHR